MEVKEMLAESLKKVRGNQTHSEFARRLNINRTTLYLYENGKRMLPAELIYKIWEEYKVSPNEMYNVKC